MKSAGALIALALAGCSTSAVTTTTTITQAARPVAQAKPVTTHHEVRQIKPKPKPKLPLWATARNCPDVADAAAGKGGPACKAWALHTYALQDAYAAQHKPTQTQTQTCPAGTTPNDNGDYCASNDVIAGCRRVISATSPSYFDCSGDSANTVALPPSPDADPCPSGYLPDWGSSSVHPNCVSDVVQGGCHAVILPDGFSGWDDNYCDTPPPAGSVPPTSQAGGSGSLKPSCPSGYFWDIPIQRCMQLGPGPRVGSSFQ